MRVYDKRPTDSLCTERLCCCCYILNVTAPTGGERSTYVHDGESIQHSKYSIKLQIAGVSVSVDK